MTENDLQVVLGWAAEEGWNPGLDDAAAFHAADPEGFFLKEVRGVPAAAVSVVNHTPEFAFLGLYICRPEFRGQGYGMEIWRAGLGHAGDRCIGLDGVPAQEDNYARSGFSRHGRTVRYEGHIVSARDPHVRPVAASELPALVTRDKAVTGLYRPAFMFPWLSQGQTRQTMVLTDADKVKAYATFRQCLTGTKVGPLVASSEADVMQLLKARPAFAENGSLYVDVPEQSHALSSFLQSHDFVPTFETARMYTGAPPDYRLGKFHAIATMELG